MYAKTLALGLCALVVASSANAGVLSLEAHEIGTGDARISNWETDWGSYNRDFSRSKKIAVTLHNMSRKPVPFAVTVSAAAFFPSIPMIKILSEIASRALASRGRACVSLDRAPARV